MRSKAREGAKAMSLAFVLLLQKGHTRFKPHVAPSFQHTTEASERTHSFQAARGSIVSTHFRSFRKDTLVSSRTWLSRFNTLPKLQKGHTRFKPHVAQSFQHTSPCLALIMSSGHVDGCRLVDLYSYISFHIESVG